MSRRSISVEIFRDCETPDVSIDGAIAGLQAIQQIIESLEIVDSNRQLQLSELGAKAIRTGYITTFDIQSDFGIILTERPIIVPRRYKKDKTDEADEESDIITVGNTWPNGLTKPFALIDAARSYSVENSTEHEVCHLFKIPREGKNYDGDCHCKDDTCVVHALLKIERNALCNDCEKQLIKSAANLMMYEKLE